MHGEKMQKRVETTILNSYEMLYRMAMSYVRNEEDALDIVQETVYKAIRNANQIKNERYIQTWLCKIVMNTAMDFMRKNRKEVPIEELYEGQEEGKEDVYTDIDTQKALDVLNPREKSVVILRYFEDKKLEEIAIILNVNVNTVKSLLYRSLKKLKIEMVEGEWQYEG